MADFLSVDDLLAFAPGIDEAKAQQMVEDATALAVLAAPCLDDSDTVLTGNQQAAVRAILRGAILRWDEAGSGALASQTAGPFAQALDTRQVRRGMFWPSEITSLQSICAGTGSGQAFSVDTVSSGAAWHADVCALTFGALYCSCGANLAGYPLWERAP